MGTNRSDLCQESKKKSHKIINPRWIKTIKSIKNNIKPLLEPNVRDFNVICGRIWDQQQEIQL